MTLRDRLLRLLDDPSGFEEAVASVFEYQREHSPAYRRLCEAREVHILTCWRDVPALHVDSFKDLDLRTFAPEETVATFLTSGTTRGDKGAHYFDDLTLYREAAVRGFGAALVPDGRRLPIVSLVPGVDEAPDSSLSQMVTWVVEAYGDETSRIDPTGAGLEQLEAAPLILGTAFGLWDALERRPDLRLPEGTRVMETGGFKGRHREVTRADLHALYHRAGIDSSHVVGEYGMTELSSQWYDGVAGRAGTSPEARVYSPPPWARTRVVQPATLEDVDEGQTGLLLHVDPLNLGSVQAILTSDLGISVGGGFRYLGRSAGAPLRGCSQRDE